MPTQQRRPLVAALVALLALVIAYWLDSGVLFDAHIRADLTYDPVPLVDLTALVHLLTAAGVVAIVVAGWRSRSMVVGIGYAAVGAFLVFLPPLIWSYASSVNGAPPVLPQWIANLLWSWDSPIEKGPTGAVYVLAAAMLLTGLGVIGSVFMASRADDAVPDVAPAQ
jgi:hypothetical protein